MCAAVKLLCDYYAAVSAEDLCSEIIRYSSITVHTFMKLYVIKAYCDHSISPYIRLPGPQ